MGHVFRRIDYRIKYKAKDIEESKISYSVQQIKNSLYGDLRPQEIKAEFARKKSGGKVKKKPPK